MRRLTPPEFDQSGKFAAQFWPLSLREEVPRVKDLHLSFVHHYAHPYPREKYRVDLKTRKQRKKEKHRDRQKERETDTERSIEKITQRRYIHDSRAELDGCYTAGREKDNRWGWT
jgi:hypothetical protein